MAQNTIKDLHDILFDTLRDLRNPDNPMDIERAKAVSDTAQVLVNAAKVEVDYVRAAGGKGSGFIALPAVEEGGARGDTVTKIPGGRLVEHRLKG